MSSFKKVVMTLVLSIFMCQVGWADEPEGEDIYLFYQTVPDTMKMPLTWDFEDTLNATHFGMYLFSLPDGDTLVLDEWIPLSERNFYLEFYVEPPQLFWVYVIAIDRSVEDSVEYSDRSNLFCFGILFPPPRMFDDIVGDSLNTMVKRFERAWQVYQPPAMLYRKAIRFEYYRLLAVLTGISSDLLEEDDAQKKLKRPYLRLRRH